MPTNLHRPIRSFVRREGRLTSGQIRALDELLPRYQIETNSIPLNFADIFGNHNPVVMEIGFGNGLLLAEQADKHPEFNFIGIEVHRPGVGRLLQQLDKQKSNNVRVMSHDAVDILSTQVTPGSLFAIWLYFPDPWPKKRHHKRRIVNERFLDLVSSSLQIGGILHMATDWRDYAVKMRQAIVQHPRLTLIDKSELVNYPFNRPATHFERRGQRKGHVIMDMYARIEKTDPISLMQS